MARVTVEDCLEHVENRFKLVLLASKRARQLSMGTEPLVEWENDKPTVVALREIEEGLVDEEMMEAALAQPVDDDLPFDEDDLAAALHAEISRELTQPAPEGQIASQSTSTSPSSLLAAPAANPFGNSPEPSEAPASEASSMESLLAQELAAAKTDAPVEAAPENPFASPSEPATLPEASQEASPEPSQETAPETPQEAPQAIPENPFAPPADSSPANDYGIPTSSSDTDEDK